MVAAEQPYRIRSRSDLLVKLAAIYNGVHDKEQAVEQALAAVTNFINDRQITHTVMGITDERHY